jgi:hypothetical protein
MTARRNGLAAALALGLLSTAAWADPPQIKNITPSGLPRGVATELTIDGANLAASPRLIAPIPAQVEPPAMGESDAAKWKLRLTVPADVPVGVYSVRVQTDEGLSNPFLLAVGQVPNVAEAEPNNRPEQAQAVALPCTVEGQASGNDVDYFQFAGRQGQKILIDAQCARIGSGVDPQLRLTQADGTYLASADDTPGLFTDARMVVTLPVDGDYVVELSDTKYQGGGRPVYRLLLGELPAADEVYPLGGRRGETLGIELRGGSLPAPAAAAATIQVPAPGLEFRPRLTNQMLGLVGPSDPVYDVELPSTLDVSDVPELREPGDPDAPPVRGVAPVVFNGRIDPAGDEDRFLLAVTPGQSLRVRVHAADIGSALDGTLSVRNAANDQQVASGDDVTVPPTGLRGQPRKGPGATSADPTLDVTVPGGVTELALVLRDLAGHGGMGYPYRIEVEPATPAFDIQFTNDDHVNIPKGGTVVVPLTVVRQGHGGPIEVTIADPPPGLTVRPAHIADGQPVGALGLSAAPDADFGAVVLNVVGNAQGPGGPIAERAGKLVVYSKVGELPTNVARQIGLAAAPSPARVLALDTPAEPIEAVHGFSASIPIKVARDGDAAKGELTVQPAPLPPGVAVPELKIAADAAEGTATVNIAPDTAAGKVTIGLTAKGKIQDKDQVFGVPAVTLDVVRPAAVTLATPRVEIKPGETVELKGQLARRGPFKEPVTLTLNGLPAGVKAEPQTVAPDATEFAFPIKAEADAGAAEANAQVAFAAFKVGDKDYNTPPVPLAVKVVK